MSHSLGSGCSKCGFEKLAKERSFTLKEFILNAKKVHGNIYDYSQVEYKNTTTKIAIICTDHGIFHQTAGNHLGGSGCPDCGNKLIGDKLRMTTRDFIERSSKIHKK